MVFARRPAGMRSLRKVDQWPNDRRVARRDRNLSGCIVRRPDVRARRGTGFIAVSKGRTKPRPLVHWRPALDFDFSGKSTDKKMKIVTGRGRSAPKAVGFRSWSDFRSAPSVPEVMAEGVGSPQNCSGLSHRNEGRSLEVHRWNAQKFEYPFGGRLHFRVRYSGLARPLRLSGDSAVAPRGRAGLENPA